MRGEMEGLFLGFLLMSDDLLIFCSFFCGWLWVDGDASSKSVWIEWVGALFSFNLRVVG